VKRYFQQLAYFLFWIIFFVITKGIFLLYHHTKTAALTATEIAKVFLYALKMDASSAGYLCIFPFLLFFLQSFIKKESFKKIIYIYTISLVIIISFLTIADLELYNAWGFRLDDTPLQYFNTPKEMFATASSAPVILLLSIFILLCIFFIWIYTRFFKKQTCIKTEKAKLAPALFSFLCLIILFIPIRGGIQQIPILQSDVYFSNKLYANHAALNVMWNVTAAILNKRSAKKNPYLYFENKVAQQYLDSLYPVSQFKSVPIFTSTKPNIIVIILESYTAKFIGSLGGEPGVTPHLDEIAKQGLLFTNIYASGDRSEKGLVAILSGYPSQSPSIIKTPTKTEGLPHLSKTLHRQGYHSSYYYGGEPEFANIKSYLLNAGYDKIISKTDFDSKDYNSKWGVHDHVLFNRFLKDMQIEKQPFFSTLFTLSSHEPYDIPILPKFAGNDETIKFKNSFYYTDQCIGNFIEEAKKQKWWDSTLIIMVADHGHRLPGDDANDVPTKFRIPLILSGGALKVKNVINNSIGSQTDIVKTLLQQLNISADEFKWSRNLLDTSAKQFAFYNFIDGFGFITPSGAVTFDNVSKKIIYKNASVTEEQLNYGKAYMQLSCDDFLRR
jgi:phosphoglycerol transferase MdoB-like AlkP superfamily enzyme